MDVRYVLERNLSGLFVLKLRLLPEPDVLALLGCEGHALMDRATKISGPEDKDDRGLTRPNNAVRAYFELLELDLELEIARQTTDSCTQTLSLFSYSFADCDFLQQRSLHNCGYRVAFADDRLWRGHPREPRFYLGPEIANLW
jgi:hypothetical protein